MLWGIITVMPIGQLIRDTRNARGWTQQQLSDRLATSAADPSGAPGRDAVKRWEAGKVIPSRHWLSHLSHALGVQYEQLKAEASLDRVNRRAFAGMAALVAVHGGLASEVAASIATHDPGPLAQVQTSHAADLVIAHMVDKPSAKWLTCWMRDGDSAILRVNSAGILAKDRDQDHRHVIRVLEHDDEVRHLYSTAVVSRVCAVDWTTAGTVAANPAAFPHRAELLATRLSREAVNPHDAGSRWCSARLLQTLAPLIGRSPHR